MLFLNAECHGTYVCNPMLLRKIQYDYGTKFVKGVFLLIVCKVGKVHPAFQSLSADDVRLMTRNKSIPLIPSRASQPAV